MMFALAILARSVLSQEQKLQCLPEIRASSWRSNDQSSITELCVRHDWKVVRVQHQREEIVWSLSLLGAGPGASYALPLSSCACVSPQDHHVSKPLRSMWTAHSNQNGWALRGSLRLLDLCLVAQVHVNGEGGSAVAVSTITWNASCESKCSCSSDRVTSLGCTHPRGVPITCRPASDILTELASTIARQRLKPPD
jgi:hypothetical protein